MRLFKYVLLSLSATFYMDIRAEAKRRNVSMSTLIRTAVKLYLSDPRMDPNSLLHEPVVNWTSAEQRVADEVLRLHFEEDR
jgi:hypothetical protein